MSSDKPYGLKTWPYPLSYETTLDLLSRADFVVGNPIRTTDPTWFVLCMTNEECLQFTSAIQEGANLIYPDDWERVYQLWEQARQFPNDFPPTICVDAIMGICALVLDCLLNDIDVREAVGDIVREVINDPDNVPGGSGSLAPASGSLDCVWGGCIKVANYVIDNVITLATLIQGGADIAGEIFRFFPGLSTLTVRIVIETFESIVIPAYIALHDDPDYRISVGCDLFCHLLETSTDPENPLPGDFDGWWAAFVPDFIMYGVAEGITSGYMAKLFNLAQDECDNDWLLCECITVEAGDVDAEGAILTLPAPATTYIVSITGQYAFAAPAGHEGDGLYRTYDNWSTYEYTEPLDGTRLQWRNLGDSGWSEFEYRDWSELNGYVETIVTTAASVQFRIYDSGYGDNSGNLHVEIVPKS